MSVIDMHTHAFPDDLAGRAIATLEAAAQWKAVAGGTVRELLESMDAADVDVSAVCTIATKPDQVKGIFKWCKKIRSDRLEAFPSVHPQTPKAAEWIHRFAEAGFAGIKLHPMYQNFAVDDPVMDPIYEAAAECGLVVAMHCGEDIAYRNDDRADPARVRRVIDRHSGLKFLATHMGGWQSWQAVREHLLGQNLYMETSFCTTFMEPEKLAELIRLHGPQRVVFGTDWPWTAQAEEIRRIQKLPLDAKEIDRILCTNAARLLYGS